MAEVTERDKRTPEQVAVEICEGWRCSLPDGSRMNRNQLARLAKTFASALATERAEILDHTHRELCHKQLIDSAGNCPDVPVCLSCHNSAVVEAAQKMKDAMIAGIPDSWLDSLLTGPDEVMGEHPWGCPTVERLVQAIKERLEKVTYEQS